MRHRERHISQERQRAKETVRGGICNALVEGRAALGRSGPGEAVRQPEHDGREEPLDHAQ
jgi:hypothetical protein